MRAIAYIRSVCALARVINCVSKIKSDDFLTQIEKEREVGERTEETSLLDSGFPKQNGQNGEQVNVSSNILVATLTSL